MNKNNQLEFNKKSIILLPGRAKQIDKFKIRDCNLEDSNIKKIRRKKKLVKKKISVFLFITILGLNAEKKYLFDYFKRKNSNTINNLIPKSNSQKVNINFY